MCLDLQPTSLNPTPVNLSTRLSLGGHQVVKQYQGIVATLSHLVVDGLTGVGLSEVDYYSSKMPSGYFTCKLVIMCLGC